MTFQVQINADYHYAEDVSKPLPERRLCAAVLERAVKDYLSVCNGENREDRRSAFEWFESDEFSSDGESLSFLFVCDAISGPEGDPEGLAKLIRSRLKLDEVRERVQADHAKRQRNKYTVTLGSVFGKLTVLYRHREGKRKNVMCRCECGVEKAYCYTDLVTGCTRSCGCSGRGKKNSYWGKRRLAMDKGEIVAA